MNRFSLLLFFPLCLALLISCSSSQKVVTQPYILEGISGKILWREGNFEDNRNRSTLSAGVSREIYIYELTNINQVNKSSDFFTDIKTSLITKVTSNPDGTFKVALPSGTYSIFTKENDGFYANIFDEENNIFPVTVEPGRVLGITIIVDYKAVY